MRITVEFAGREYVLKTTEPQDIVDEVIKRIKDILGAFEKDVEEFPRDEILFVALANAVLNQIKLEREMEKLAKRLKEWSHESGDV